MRPSSLEQLGVHNCTERAKEFGSSRMLEFLVQNRAPPYQLPPPKVPLLERGIVSGSSASWVGNVASPLHNPGATCLPIRERGARTAVYAFHACLGLPFRQHNLVALMSSYFLFRRRPSRRLFVCGMCPKTRQTRMSSLNFPSEIQ